MADKGSIGSRLQLDGEAEYKKALNDAYRSLRVLRSELKAETAELGRNATAQDKDAKKVESLKKQIEQQKKIVETLQKALEESREEYADNAEVQDKWEEKLNKAREALARMENEMGSAQDSLKSFSNEMSSVDSSSERGVTAVVNLNDALSSISGLASGVGSTLSGIFSSTVDTMESMVETMFELMGKAWSAAGDWKQLATIWGGNTEDIERVMTGLKLQGVDPGQATAAIQKLVTNTDNGNKETIAALKKLGISESDYSNHWDYFMDVMTELSTRRHNKKELDQLSTALFGDKSGMGMTDVIDNWNEALNKYDQDVKGTGLHLYDDEIEALDQVSHKITEIQELWDVMKTNVGAKLSDILNIDGLATDTLDVLRDFAAIFSGSTTGELSEEKKAELVMKLDTDIQKLLNDITESLGNLSGTLQDLGGDLESSDNPIVQFMGKLIKSTGDLLDWVATNGDTIIGWLNTLLPLMGANTVSEALTGMGLGDWFTQIIDLLTKIAVIVGVKGLAGKVGAGAAGTAGAAGAAGAGAAAAGGATVGWLAKAKNLLGNPLTAGVGAFLTTLLTPGKTATDAEEAAMGSRVGADTWDVTPRAHIETGEGGYSAEEHARKVRESLEGWEKLQERLNAPTVEENETLADYTAQEIEGIIQDWWDAYKDYDQDPANSDEESREMALLQDALGDGFGDFYDRWLQYTDETENVMQVDDLPADLYSDLISLQTGLDNLLAGQYTGEKVQQDINSAKTAVETAVRNGLAAAHLTLTVNLDGEPVYRQVGMGLGSLLARM